MTIHERVSRIADFLADNFAGGDTSIHVDDVMDDASGLKLQDEINAVLNQYPNGGTGSEATDLAIQALSVIGDVWGSGYDLAKGEDWVTDNETVAEILTNFVSREDALKPR